MPQADANKCCKHCGGTGPRYARKAKGANGQLWKCSDSVCIKCRGEYLLDRRQKLKADCVARLGGKCLDCGLVDDPVVYDFHHNDPRQKDFAFGRRAGYKLESGNQMPTLSWY